MEFLHKADWTTAYVNDLPDSAFLYVEGGGKKDSSGKTVPRSLRHFPYKGPDGSVDVPHVRNAIARIPQSAVGLSASQKEVLQNRARKLLQGAKKSMDMVIDMEKGFLVSSSKKKSYRSKKMIKSEEATDLLNDFIKSTIEDEKQPTIGTGKEQGEQNLDGKGKPAGGPKPTKKAEVGAVSGSKTNKLSEDDEEGENALKPHTKPIEETGRNTTRKSMQNPKEQVAYEQALFERSIMLKSADIVPPMAPPTREKVEVLHKSTDEQCVEYVEKGGEFICNTRSVQGSPLTVTCECTGCGGFFQKALTVCPHCGCDR